MSSACKHLFPILGGGIYLFIFRELQMSKDCKDIIWGRMLLMLALFPALLMGRELSLTRAMSRHDDI